jgi:predicted CXXCH cytochrome family protein
LVSPASDLCFTCHEKSSDKVLHRPYAEGECVACHSPHTSNYPNQLLTDSQDLCLGCHARSRLKVNRRKQQVTTPWGVTLTFTQMQGWQYLNLNKTLAANHPIEGHPVTGPNTALGRGSPEITCLSCHEPHHSKNPNLTPPNVKNQTALCETCHTNF